MLAVWERINEHIQKYMTASGYTLSLKSKQYHALDSFVYEYVNAGGMKDNLKIEINYMLRRVISMICSTCRSMDCLTRLIIGEKIGRGQAAIRRREVKGA